jgi:hypothetical protein
MPRRKWPVTEEELIRTRECSKCHETKTLSEYARTVKDIIHQGGRYTPLFKYMSWCKECHKEYQKNRYQEKKIVLDRLDAEYEEQLRQDREEERQYQLSLLRKQFKPMGPPEV